MVNREMQRDFIDVQMAFDKVFAKKRSADNRKWPRYFNWQELITTIWAVALNVIF